MLSAVGVNGRGALALLLVLLLLALIAPARATRGGAGGWPAGQLQRVAPGEGPGAIGERHFHSRFTIHDSRFFGLAPHSSLLAPSAYDALGRLTNETSQGFNHRYAYDLAGNRTNTVLGTGRTIRSTFDGLNRLTAMDEGGRVTEFAYDPASRRVRQTVANGGQVLADYDALGRMRWTETISPNNTLLQKFTHAHDLAGNVVRIQEDYAGGLPARTVVNAYDGANRLISEQISGASNVLTTYAYDAANNRIERSINGVVTEYQYNALNQLVSWTGPAGSGTNQYDAGGSLQWTRREYDGGARWREMALTNDAENRLQTITQWDDSGGSTVSNTWEYAYDHRTRRVARTGAGGTNWLISFSGGLSVAEREWGQSTAAVEYVRGPDWGGGVGGMLYSVRGGEVRYSHANHRGDVTLRTDEAGEATWRGAYEAFGTRSGEQGSDADRFRANTKEEDPTGLLLEGYRYRDLETGQFLSRDPAGLVDGPNLYTYVLQNPWTKFDPLGLKRIKDHKEDIQKAETRFQTRAKEIDSTYSGKEKEAKLKDAQDALGESKAKSNAAIKSIEQTAKDIKENLGIDVDPAVLDDALRGFDSVGDRLTRLRERYAHGNQAQLSKLDPRFQGMAKQFVSDANSILNIFGYEIRVTYGFRSFEQQAQLYKAYLAGGPKAAPPGKSAHNYGIAIDVAIIDGNRVADGDKAARNTLGAIGEARGLRWGNSFGDPPHFEHPQTPSGSVMLERHQSRHDVLTGTPLP
jgi:RHS repeat-associated protein